VLGKDYKALILDWFENYKVPDGKPQNKFSHNKSYQSHEMAIEIIEECHHQWHHLLVKSPLTGKSFALESHALRHLIDDGLISNDATSKHHVISSIKYPDLNWTVLKL